MMNQNQHSKKSKDNDELWRLEEVLVVVFLWYCTLVDLIINEQAWKRDYQHFHYSAVSMQIL